jgi:hypothetical protein
MPGAPPVFPWLDTSRNYMAGLTRSVAEARLAQQSGMNGPNLYAYAENKPVKYTDPTGLTDNGSGECECKLPCKPVCITCYTGCTG